MIFERVKIVTPFALCLLLLNAAGHAADLPDYCAVDGVRRIPDKLEAYVQSGIGLAPNCDGERCCIEQKFHHIRIARRHEPTSVWTRVVRFDELDVGLSNKAVSVSVVDAFGRSVPGASAEVEVRNSNVITDSKGFGFLPVVVSFTDHAPTAKVYRLRFAYADSLSISHSYGPHFYVTDAPITSDLMDFLYTSGFSIQK